MKGICLIWLLLDFYVQSFAQSDTTVCHPVNNIAVQQFSIRTITTVNDGKLWLSTDKGVVSFDGNDVQLFDHKDEDSNSIRFSSIMTCYPDSKGNLYVNMVATGVDYLNTKTGKATHLNIQVPSKDSARLSFPTAYSWVESDDETIWLGFYNLGFAQYHLKTKQTDCYYLHKDLNAGKNSVYTIQKDKKNVQLLWLATEDGIYSFNKNTKELKLNFHCSTPADSTGEDINITSMVVNNSDSIWFVVRGKGIGCYNVKSGSYTIYPQLKNEGTKDFNRLNINQLLYKNADEFYIGLIDYPVGVFNIKTHKYTFASKTFNYLPSANVSYFLKDSSGNMWVVVLDKLYVAHPVENKFATIQVKNHYYSRQTRNRFITMVWSNETKKYYAGFDMGDGIFILDSNFNFVRSITAEVVDPSYSPETRVLTEAVDGYGRLWMTNRYFMAYDSLADKLLLSEKIFPNLKFTDQRFQNITFRGNYMYLQPSNINNQALYRINIKTLTCDSIPYPQEMIDKKEFNRENKTFDVAEIDKETKFVYTAYHNSLFQLNLRTNQLRKIVTLSDSLKLWQQIFNMFWYRLDDNNRLWVATTKEIRIYETNNLQLIKTIPVVKDSYILQLYNIDGRGIMCVLYSGGILLYDYKNDKEFRLSSADGLIHDVGNTGLACVNNVLFTGSANYLQYIPLDNVIKRNLNRRCYLSEIKIFNRPLNADTLPQYLHVLELPHDRNFIELTFSSNEFEQPERLEYRYRLEGINSEWIYTNFLNRTISYNNLNPGSYNFYTSIKNADGSWSNNETSLNIIVLPAWWQTNWFKFLATLIACSLVYLLVRWRIKSVRRQEQLKGKHEKEMLELEAKALRAQMNPHFIFNCMNSIKSLIQKNEQDKAVNYLTTFSKLIRTIFQNSDKREITLYDEIETCRLYTQLESMRFGNKFNYEFNMDETLDLKSVRVPALVIQPFIENAIWHGIMPKAEGGVVNVTVDKTDHAIRCIIDDDGIGREVSKQNKFKGEPSTHQSKGIHLTQSRLDLDNLLNQRNATLETIDKKDEEGKSSGTIVVLTFKEY